MNQEIISFLKMALECSVLIDPPDPGLTFQELSEIGKRAGYLDGEINDALARLATGTSRSRMILPSPPETLSWVFLYPEEPDYRNFDAFDFVVTQLNELTRSVGAAK